MMPSIKPLRTLPNVTYWWDTSKDGKRHTLVACVDSWQLDVPYAICWIEGQALTDAIEAEHLPAGTGPGWFIQDDCGVVLAELFKPIVGRPLDELLWREIAAKLEEVHSEPETAQ
ncbi:hypothetical protein [Billgrantia montanilacus]|uniref:Uncharacterized protein n=1 Tax=Billgrantia montanilacus TaxID=2282305 RepID=A0A368U074_9GAMM|nr:hypothetical protein [Halomonas montanilacus]RCV90490.1 hypothetical protein DU505_06020 [Halomonas montanilacus]